MNKFMTFYKKRKFVCPKNTKTVLKQISKMLGDCMGMMSLHRAGL